MANEGSSSGIWREGEISLRAVAVPPSSNVFCCHSNALLSCSGHPTIFSRLIPAAFVPRWELISASFVDARF